jgi:hypothetical protein
MVISDLVTSAIASLSVVLVFLVMFQGYAVMEYYRYRDEELHRGDTALQNQKSKYRRFLWLKLIPLTLADLSAIYVFLPVTIAILRQSTFSATRFDVVRTSFLLIQALILGMVIMQAAMVFKMIGKLSEKKR